jgi:hypothetical protein
MSGHSKTATCWLRVFPIMAIAALLAACADTGARPEAATAAMPSGETLPTSVEDARTQCWMRYENKKMQVKNLDEKIKLVDKCIDEKMKLLPAAASR